MDVLEETLRPKDSGTIYTHIMEYIQLADGRYSLYSKILDALEKVRELDQEFKCHILKYKVYSKDLYSLS